MSFRTLYPDEAPMVKRKSSIDQFAGFFAVMEKGGWEPIVFDQLDGISCRAVKSHPTILSWSNDIGYIFRDGQCNYASDKFVYFDKNGIEQRLLPTCFGGEGEFYDEYVNKNSFVDFDNNSSLGTHSALRRRVGLSYALSDKTLPAE